MTLPNSARACAAISCSLLAAAFSSAGCAGSETVQGTGPDWTGPGDTRPNAPLLVAPADDDAAATPPETFADEAWLDLTGDEADWEASATAKADCGTTYATPETLRMPIDIIVILDNSGSMGNETESVEKNVNHSFARILDENSVDYRMIVLSEHRKRDGQNAICVAQPLSGLGSCPAPRPVESDRFHQYSVEIGSRNSLQRVLETYDGSREDDFGIAPGGWSEWLRPGAAKVFLEFTDDDANLSASDFVTALSELAPEHFGTPETPHFVWHSIIGLAEKSVPTDAYLASDPIENGECRGNDNNVFNAGRTYQDLSRRTGGLRFPICQFQAYDTVFRTIASDLVRVSSIQCDFPLPSPPVGQRLELDKVALSYVPGAGGATQVFGQAASAEACEADAFFIEGGSVRLCQQACDLVRADSSARIDVLFTCDSTLIVR